MNIVVYADESGTHDLSSKQDRSKVAVLAGYAGLADDWINFCGRWQTVLNEYKVSEFHFSEFADQINSSKDPSWPYFGWSKERRHEFLFKLASIAGSRARFTPLDYALWGNFNGQDDFKNYLRKLLGRELREVKL